MKKSEMKAYYEAEIYRLQAELIRAKNSEVQNYNRALRAESRSAAFIHYMRAQAVRSMNRRIRAFARSLHSIGLTAPVDEKRKR